MARRSEREPVNRPDQFDGRRVTLGVARSPLFVRAVVSR